MYDFITKKEWAKVKSRSRSASKSLAKQVGLTLQGLKGGKRYRNPDFEIVGSNGQIEGLFDCMVKYGWQDIYKYPNLRIPIRVSKWLDKKICFAVFNYNCDQCYLVGGSVVKVSPQKSIVVENRIRLQDEVETFYSVDKNQCQLWKKTKVGRKIIWKQI